MLVRWYRETPAEAPEECVYVEVSEPLTAEEAERLRWLIAETYEPSRTGSASFLAGDVLEIGPRLSVETPFSSNAVSICAAMGLGKVRRVERARRFLPSANLTKEALAAAHLDRMTEEVYAREIAGFEQAVSPAPVRTIPLLRDGEAALREVNVSLGLGMDEWDLAFYADLFRRYGRNPTDVELFQIGNANSEHSRHWFFRGRLVIGGREMPESLFDIVRAPLAARGEESNSVLAFRDNAGAIRGHEALVFAPKDPGRPSRFAPVRGVWHVTCTAETHNHPTFVAPYPGAETGAGGRIRDNTAPGCGALPVAGLGGYCVGNLFLPGHEIPGEAVGGEELARYASPLRILIEGSNGVSDYGNRFGEPLIGGFTRTFGQRVGGERREFRKPVLYSAGIGRMQAIHAEKRPPERGMKIVRIGGPAYRIGVGGGSASSMMHGANAEDLDFNSVQRGNAEMENRANRVIRACVEMGEENPIESIHDQGAGGPSNVLTELLEPAGGRIDIRQIVLGDRTMSVLEIWSAEYQEGYGLLVREERLPEFRAVCERERVNCEVVGEITGDGHVTVIDSLTGETPVRLSLEDILTGIPRKTFRLERIPKEREPFALPEVSLREAVRRVFLLPQVGSKGFLVHKADRSVTGLVARQQCCGPAQIPVADASVTADGYFGLTGAAAAIGEQPVKMLVHPAAGARMAVGEMLTNMMGVRISDLGGIRCRANWMWAAKLPGEGALLYDAAVAVRDLMVRLGIAIDGGKDSLSMAATIQGEVVKSPGELVVLGYATVPDIRKVLTPDFKGAGTAIGFIDLGEGKNRMGGSSLFQAFSAVGGDVPDVDNADLLARTFRAVQDLIESGLILSFHDRSDGGLAATLAEMCLAGDRGAVVSLPEGTDAVQGFLSEELGAVFEYRPEGEARIRGLLEEKGIPFSPLGTVTARRRLVIEAEGEPFDVPLDELREWWEATSDRLELLQTEGTAVRSQRMRRPAARDAYRLAFRPEPTPSILLSAPRRHRVAVLREEGTNGDREMAAAFYAAGLEPWDVTMSDLLAGRASLDSFRGLAFPGGFSFMDTFGSGKGWAGTILFNERLREMFDRFYARPDTFSLGVCNGCQLMALLGWIPRIGEGGTAQPRFVRNASGRFESRWASVRIRESPSILFGGMAGSVLGIWVAHGEGRLVFPDSSVQEEVVRRSLVPLEYVGPDGSATEDYPYNPNGSPSGWTALCSPDGRHLAMMPHPERCFLPWQWAWMPPAWKDLETSPWLRMFQNARVWCNKNQ